MNKIPSFRKPIIFDVVGAHSTGKTTVINQIKDYFLFHHHIKPSHHESVSRTHLKEKQLKLYNEVDDLFQCYISLLNWSSIFHLSLHNQVICSTDLVVRSLAYSLAGQHCSTSVEVAHKEMLDFVKEILTRTFDVYWIYLPVEFPIVKDGVRDADEDFRLEVDKMHRYIFRTCEIPHYILKGRIEDRKQKLFRFLDSIVMKCPDSSCELM